MMCGIVQSDYRLDQDDLREFVGLEEYSKAKAIRDIKKHDQSRVQLYGDSILYRAITFARKCFQAFSIKNADVSTRVPN